MAFFDTPGVCAVEAEGMMKEALETFQNRDVITYSFKNVGKGIVTPAKVASLAEECKTAAIMTRPTGEDGIVSYQIHVMKTRWDQEKEETVDKQVREWYSQLELVNCPVCKHAYHIGDNSACEEKYHPGERQLLESGDMEMLMTVDGKERTKVSLRFPTNTSGRTDRPGDWGKQMPADESLLRTADKTR